MLLNLLVAFNTVDHTALLNCLKSWFGICSAAWKWFASYLSHRFQAIKIGPSFSELCELMFGVPQGTLSKVIEMHADIKFQFHADNTHAVVYSDVSQKCSPCFLQTEFMFSRCTRMGVVKYGQSKP